MTTVFDGVGVASWQAIVAAARLSGLYGPDPLLRDTNDLDHDGQGSFHDTGNAVDFGDDQQNGSPQQTDFANWVAKNFGPYSLEIIHTNWDNTGVYWKYGKVVSGPDFYGQPTVDAHRNHVHWAITLAGLTAGINRMGIDIVATMPTVDSNTHLDMNAPDIRTCQGLLEARGGLIKPDNTSTPVLNTVIKWFQEQAGLAVDGKCGLVTWQRLMHPLNGK